MVIGLFLLCEFFIGVIVGASIAKERESFRRGFVIAMLLAFAVLLYGTVLGTLAKESFDNAAQAIAGVLGVIVFLLTIGFCIWVICLLVACAGYWSAFILFRRLGIGPNRVTLGATLAFMSALAAVAALARVA